MGRTDWNLETNKKGRRGECPKEPEKMEGFSEASSGCQRNKGSPIGESDEREERNPQGPL